MTSVKKGLAIKSGEWCKHLRPEGRRHFWKRHRLAERRDIEKSATEIAVEDAHEFSEELDRQAECNVERLKQLAAANPPPQHWFDGDEEDLFGSDLEVE